VGAAVMENFRMKKECADVPMTFLKPHVPFALDIEHSLSNQFSLANMATHLQAGQKAPLFSGKDQDGNTVSLKDFRGKKVVLYFYPEDDTPTCTVQACNLRDNYTLLKNAGYEVIGISPNDEQSHQKFRKKFDLPFTLIADGQRRIIGKYGVWGEKQLYGRTYEGLHRTTFVLDANGIIEKVILRPRSKVHAAEILK
jgi:peroxiredoxin Q/BCP